MSDERVFVGDLTRREFRERIQAGTIKAAIVPTAATEQHNEHLHMIHDTFHVSYMADHAAKKLLPQVVVATPVGIGVSEHWMDHIGTLTVRPEIFCEYVFDVCNSLVRAGVENVLDVIRGGIDATMRGIGVGSITDLGPEYVIVPDGFSPPRIS